MGAKASSCPLRARQRLCVIFAVLSLSLLIILTFCYLYYLMSSFFSSSCESMYILVSIRTAFGRWCPPVPRTFTCFRIVAAPFIDFRSLIHTWTHTKNGRNEENTQVSSAYTGRHDVMSREAILGNNIKNNETKHQSAVLISEC
jgi:uncharacterized protein YggT (Ycf19 family)